MENKNDFKIQDIFCNIIAGFVAIFFGRTLFGAEFKFSLDSWDYYLQMNFTQALRNIFPPILYCVNVFLK